MKCSPITPITTYIGNKKVVTTITEKIWNELPSYYNDGIGGTNVKRIKIDSVFNEIGQFLGKRIEESHFLTEINENGKMYIPQKPFYISKQTTKESLNHSTITYYNYGNGYRNYKVDLTTRKTLHYQYSSGMPNKK